MDSTGLNHLVRARDAREPNSAASSSSRACPEPIDRILAVSGVDKAFETTADPAPLEN